ncbi:MAG: DUF4366 domain-containing protein [Stomatobaculum sp.]|nr:DUF4366 domain-containing protein [Stomatobaculum sp.]
MMKMRIAAVMAAVMIGTAAVPAVTAFAQGNDPEQTAAAEAVSVEATAAETKDAAVEGTPADTATAESGKNSGTDSAETEGKEDSGDPEGESYIDIFNTDDLTISGLPGSSLSLYADLLSDLDPEVIEVLLKNPKLLAYFLPTLHVTVTDTSVTIAVDGDAPEEEPTRTGTVRTNGSNLNVRTGPGIGYDIISSLKNGSEIEISGEENGWYQIVFPAKYAYVCGQYVELNDITPTPVPEGYTFDIDGEMLAEFLSAFAYLFEEEEPQPVPEIHGLTPDGNLTLVDDIGPVTGEGQQFVTLVTKAGNYFYLIIDRDEKGEETVHFLNLVDERDLFTLMEEDEQNAYNEQLALEQAAKEAAEKAAAEAATAESGEGDDEENETQKKSGGRNMLPLLLIPLILAGAGGGWFYLQSRKKKQTANTPDPDADYLDEDDDEEDYGAGEEDVVIVSDTLDRDPYEEEILGDEDPDDTDGGISNDEEDL